MSPQIRNTVLACVGFMLVMLALFLNNAMREKLPTDDELLARGIVVIPRPRELEPMTLEASDGGAFTNEDLKGQWTFAYFGFTNCPDICPVSLSLMAQAERLLAERQAEGRFQGVLVSVDPQRDRPDVLAEYVQFFSPNFRGVTGTHEGIVGLTTQVSVAFAAVPEPSAPDGYVVDHTGNIAMIDPRGNYVGYIRPPHTAEQIAEAYEALAARE